MIRSVGALVSTARSLRNRKIKIISPAAPPKSKIQSTKRSQRSPVVSGVLDGADAELSSPEASLPVAAGGLCAMFATATATLAPGVAAIIRMGDSATGVAGAPRLALSDGAVVAV